MPLPLPALLSFMLAAPPPTARLVIQSAPDCGDASVIAAHVRERLAGRDPFEPDAARLAHVRFTRGPDGFLADIALIEADGRRGDRRLTDASCPELERGVALALAVAIDPLAVFGPAPVVPVPRRAPEAMAPSRRRDGEVVIDGGEVGPVPVAAAPIGVGVAIGLGVGIGATPAASLGPLARLVIEADAWAIELDVALGFGAPEAVGGIAVETLRTSVGARGCWRAGLSVCSGLALARTWTSTTGSDARDALGWTFALVWPWSEHVALDVGLALGLTRPARIRVDGDEAWRAWPVEATIRWVLRP